MRVINIKDKEPSVGEVILACGAWEGELSSKSDGELGWHVVKYMGNDMGNIAGCCGYGAWVNEITKWVKLPKYENTKDN